MLTVSNVLKVLMILAAFLRCMSDFKFHGQVTSRETHDKYTGFTIFVLTMLLYYGVGIWHFD